MLIRELWRNCSSLFQDELIGRCAAVLRLHILRPNTRVVLILPARKQISIFLNMSNVMKRAKDCVSTLSLFIRLHKVSAASDTDALRLSFVMMNARLRGNVGTLWITETDECTKKFNDFAAFKSLK